MQQTFNQQRKIILAVATLALAGCGADTSNDPPASNTCTAASDLCTGEQVCVGGRCEDAFPRIYSLSFGAIAFPPMKPPANDCWDTPCSAPDPFIVVGVDDKEVGRTTAAQDQNTISFAGSFDVSFIAGSKLEIGLFDEDLAQHDLIGGCSADPITAKDLRDRNLSCTAWEGAFSMNFRLEPKQ